MSKEKFGPYITALREKLGITKAELARRTGMTRSYIGFIEDDAAPPGGEPPNVSVRNLSLLARELGVSEQEMLDHGYRSPAGFKLVPSSATGLVTQLIREKAATHQEFHLTAEQMDSLITDLERYAEMRLQLTAEQSQSQSQSQEGGGKQSQKQKQGVA